jgi:flagellar FliJ protein
MPARFAFAFEALLNARRMDERNHQLTVAQIERQRLRLEDELRHAQTRIISDKEQLKTRLLGAIDAHGLRMQAAATMHQMRQAQRVVLELAGVHRRLESARAALVEASRRRRAIELLREQRYEHWKSTIVKGEVAALDELAVMAAARNTRSVDDPSLNGTKHHMSGEP